MIAEPAFPNDEYLRHRVAVGVTVNGQGIAHRRQREEGALFVAPLFQGE